MKTTALILLVLVMVSCKKEPGRLTYYPCAPAAFKAKGDFTVNLPDLQSTNVKEVRLDIRTAVDDTFKIVIYGRDKYLSLRLNYLEATQKNLMNWLVKSDNSLNTLRGTVNEEVEGYINVVYY
jgi:hypothetical protein